MVIDLLVISEDDGFTAVVPSLKGCESWAHSEDEAITNVIELTKFYSNLPEDLEIKIDLARKEKNKKIYKLIFDKEP
jgi:predicted RNase H-like HicB family nuclease